MMTTQPTTLQDSDLLPDSQMVPQHQQHQHQQQQQQHFHHHHHHQPQQFHQHPQQHLFHNQQQQHDLQQHQPHFHPQHAQQHFQPTHQHLQQQQQQQQPLLQQPKSVLEELNNIFQGTQQTDNMVQANRDVYQNFVLQLQQRNRLCDGIRSMEHSPQQQPQPHLMKTLEQHKRDLNLLGNTLKQKARYLNQIRKDLIDAHRVLFNRTLDIQNKILYEYLPSWHREQQLSNDNTNLISGASGNIISSTSGAGLTGNINSLNLNGIVDTATSGDLVASPPSATSTTTTATNSNTKSCNVSTTTSGADACCPSITLDLIQQWIEKIAEITWRIKNQIKGLQLTLTDKPNVNFNTNELDLFVVEVNKSLENLILHSFVVEKQPPQVMKTNTRFTSTVRFLCGPKLNVHLTNPTVKATILSESNARSIIRQHKRLIANSWADLDHVMSLAAAANPRSSSSSIAAGAREGDASTVVGNQPVGMGIASTSESSTPSPNDHQMQAVITTTTSATAPTGAMMMLSRQQQQQQLNMNSYMNLEAQQQPQMMNTGVMFGSTSGDQRMNPPDHIMADQTVPPSSQQQQFFNHTQPISHHIQQQQQQPQQFYTQHHEATNMTYGFTRIGYNPNEPTKEYEPSGEILNNSQILELQEGTGQTVSHFRNMQLKKIKRTEKKGTESVMDEKFILMFAFEFRIADDSFLPYSVQNSSRIRRGDLMFQILAFSLPVVVIVHGNQEPHAWATVTWHNAFATPDELLYQVPEKVPWRELGQVLSKKFRSCAGRGLNEQNLRYLAGKISRNPRLDNDDILVSWNQFAKEPLPERSFTFWEWFHSILKLTKDHLRDLWNANRIYGFIDREGCTDLLLGTYSMQTRENGTFLLRFSETELGGITIAWLSTNTNQSTNEYPISQQAQQTSTQSSSSPASTSNTATIMHVLPFVSKGLNTRSLADRVRDLDNLVYLYPNIPKDEAFKSYYTPFNAGLLPNGYVEPVLKQTLRLPENSPSSQMINERSSVTPATSNSYSQSPLENMYQEGGLMVEMETNDQGYDDQYLASSLHMFSKTGN